jgi:hypothetical protein
MLYLLYIYAKFYDEHGMKSQISMHNNYSSLSETYLIN